MSKKKTDLWSGSIWGRILDLNEKKAQKGKGDSYLQMKIECSNPQYGNISVFAMVTGEERIMQMKDLYAKNPTQVIHFIGYFSQYIAEEGRRSNFFIVKFLPSSDANLRAAFVLRGTLASMTVEDEPLLCIKVTGEDSSKKPVEKDFEVVMHPDAKIIGYNAFAWAEEIKAGDYIEAAGYIRALKAMDDFGRVNSDIKPYVMELSRLGTEKPKF